jgi:hypothetical protein
MRNPTQWPLRKIGKLKHFIAIHASAKTIPANPFLNGRLRQGWVAAQARRICLFYVVLPFQ